jgi:hypothetical protein
MEVNIINETTAEVSLAFDDYDKVSELFKDVILLKDNENDPLLDQIEELLENKYYIDTKCSTWEIGEEFETGVVLNFNLLKN